MEQTDLLNDDQQKKTLNNNTENDDDNSKVDVANDMKKELEEYRQKMQKLEADNKRYLDEKKNLEIQQLKDKENWQRIAEMREQEASEYKERVETLSTALINDKKIESLKTAALSAGLRQEALADLELLDVDSLVMHETTSTGRINVIGVKQAVDTIKATRPHWFSNNRRNINSSMDDLQTTTARTTEITLDDVMKLESKARETGDKKDKEAYFKALEEFNKNKRS